MSVFFLRCAQPVVHSTSGADRQPHATSALLDPVGNAHPPERASRKEQVGRGIRFLISHRLGPQSPPTRLLITGHRAVTSQSALQA